MAQEVRLTVGVRLRLPGTNAAGRKRLRGIRNDERHVRLDDAPEPAAGFAGTHGGIEAEEIRRGRGETSPARGTDTSSSVGAKRFESAVALDVEGRFADAFVKRRFDRIEGAASFDAPQLEAVRGDDKAYGPVGATLLFDDAGEALGGKSRKGGLKREFLRNRHGEGHVKTRVFPFGECRRHAVEVVPNDVGIEIGYGYAAVRAEKLGFVREEQLQVVVELGHRSHRRARSAHRTRTVDRNCRGHPFDRVDVRSVHAIEKLTRVG